MIQINIVTRHETSADELRREYAGWEEGLTPDAIYDAARGCWSFGPRADSEKFAVVVCDKLVRCVIEINDIETLPSGDRALVGHPVGDGHPFHDRWYGRAAPSNKGGGPITYIDDTARPVSM